MKKELYLDLLTTKDLFTQGESSPKLAKGIGTGYKALGLYLAPWKKSGMNVCGHASPGCIKGCLDEAGRAGIIKHGEDTNAIQIRRLERTLSLKHYRPEFIERVGLEIERHIAKCKREKIKPAVRLNATSDLSYEKLAPQLFELDCMFYDYSKNPYRVDQFLRGQFPSNYHLTFSQSEANQKTARKLSKRGANIAVVFRDVKPTYYYEREVVDADEHDFRFLDGVGIIAGLKAKGPAKKDQSGFVVDISDRWCM